MGYPQPPTILYGDNTTAIGIASDSIKVKNQKLWTKTFTG
jgi:hypothetical protein